MPDNFPNLQGSQPMKPTARPFLGKSRVNKVIAAINAIINAKVVWGPPPQIGNTLPNNTGSNAHFDITESNGFILTLPPYPTVQGNGTNTPTSYRGEYSPGGSTTFNPGPFNFGDVVRVSPTNAVSTVEGGSVIPGVYVCVQTGAGSGNLPNHPLSEGGENSFWQWLATWPSSMTTCGADGDITVFADAQSPPDDDDDD